jgi:hypothetical protein
MMKKFLIVLGVLLLALSFSVSADGGDCVVSGLAHEYILEKNLSVPTTDLGCRLINDKFVLDSGECWVFQRATGRSFKGVMGQFMDGSWRCFLPSSRSYPVVSVQESVVPEVPEFGFVAGGIALVGGLTGFLLVRKK